MSLKLRLTVNTRKCLMHNVRIVGTVFRTHADADALMKIFQKSYCSNR